MHYVRRCRKILGRITSLNNIDFSGLAKVAHSTDATDWRIAMPFVVIKPDTEHEVAAIVRACIKLGLTIIPRGGGTGYTGGAIPLHSNTAVINTEKLEALSKITQTELAGVEGSHPVVECGAGVITRRVSDLADSNGYSLCRRPDLAGRLHYRRQYRDECGRQESGHMGYGTRQPGVLAHGDT